MKYVNIGFIGSYFKILFDEIRTLRFAIFNFLIFNQLLDLNQYLEWRETISSFVSYLKSTSKYLDYIRFSAEKIKFHL